MVRVLLGGCLLSGYALAQVCNPADIQGGYGFQLSGKTTISGKETPTAAVGRLEFDGRGKITGIASVNFNGYFLGNPVTGAYEAKDDCTITWSLQDDSGAYQHFMGSAAIDGRRMEFRQTDPGVNVRGVLDRMPDSCSAATFQGRFAVTLTGDATPFAGEGMAHVSATGQADADGTGNLDLTWGKATGRGSYQVDSDCVVVLELPTPGADGESREFVKLRGVLVNSGREVLAVQTDPERVAGARFLAK